MDDLDWYLDEPGEMVDCPRCDGWGEVSCHCGGDLCVCTNYGDAPCPLCHGEGEISEDYYQRWREAKRENDRLWAEARAKVEAEREQDSTREPKS